MALDDALGDGNSQLADSLLRQYQQDAPNFSGDAAVLTERLSRKLAPVGTQPSFQPTDFSSPPETEEPAAPDLSDFGKPVEPTPEPSTDDLSSFGTPVPGPEPAPLGVTGQLKAAGKGLLRGAPETAGSMLQGSAALTHTKPIPDEAVGLIDELGNAGSMSASERAKLMGRALRTIPSRGKQMDFNSALQRIARGGDAAAEAAKLRESFGVQNAEAAKPISESPIYKAGTSLKEGVDAAVPMTDQEKQSFGGMVGTGIAGAAPYVAAAALAGPEAAIALGIVGMGTSTAGATFEAAKAKGASDEDAAKAAGWGGAIGAALGGLPLGVVLRPITSVSAKLGSSGAAILAQHAIEGGTAFATIGEAQEYLLTKVAQQYYDPEKGYTPEAKRIIANLVAGAVVGAGASLIPKPRDISSPEDIAEFLRRAAESRQRTLPPAEPLEGEVVPDRRGLPGPDTGAAPPEPPGPETPPRPSGGAGEAATPPKTDHQRLLDAGFSESEIADMSPRARESRLAELPQESAAHDLSEAEIAALKRDGWTDADIAEHGADITPDHREQLKAATSESDVPAKTGVVSSQEETGKRDAPIVATTVDDVLKASEVVKEPKSPAQAEAENYQHGHIELPHLGLEGRNGIAIETGVGQTRKGIGADGQPWEVRMPVAYGRIKGTKGADGQPLDVFIGPNPTSPHVFMIDQRDPATDKFDEHKIMVGFDHPEGAIRAFKDAHTDDGIKRIGAVQALGAEEFKHWLANGDHTKRFTKPGPSERPTAPASEPVKAEAGAASSLTEAPVPSPGVPKVDLASGGTSPDRPKSQTAKPAVRSNENMTLLQFIASRGGLAPHPELAALDVGDHRVQIPGRKGFFGVVRPTGDTLDMIREAAEEAGYLRGEHNKSSTVRDLLDAIDEEINRGNPKHAEGEEGHKTKRRRVLDEEASAAARQAAVDAHHDEIEADADYKGLADDVKARAAAIMADERLPIDDAVEQAAMRMVSEDADYGITPQLMKDTYGERVHDGIQAKAASGNGVIAKPAGKEREGNAEAGQKAQGHVERVPDTGAESGEAKIDRLLADEGYKLVGDENGIKTFLHSEDADAAQVRRIGNTLKSQGFTLDGSNIRTFTNKETGEIATFEPGGEDTSGHYLHIDSEPAEVTAAHHQAIEDVLGPMADQVLPVDITRAAEKLAEHPDMPPEIAFQHAVIEGAVNRGDLTIPQAEEAYGPEVKQLLEPEREGAPVSGAHVEQGSAAPIEKRAGDGEENRLVQGRSQTGGTQTGDSQDDNEPDAGRADADAAGAGSDATKAAQTVARGRSAADRANAKEAERERAAERKRTDDEAKLKAQLAELPDGIEAIAADYRSTIDKHDAAVVAGKEADATKLRERLHLLEVKVNDGTTFGMATKESAADALRSAESAPIGSIPKWHQRGVFVLPVKGVNFIVTHNAGSGPAIYAIDKDKPFPSDTGYRSMLGSNTDRIFGSTVTEHWQDVIGEYMREAAPVAKKAKKGQPAEEAQWSTPDAWYRLPDNYDDQGYPERVGDNWPEKYPNAKRGEADIQAEDSDEVVHVTLTPTGPWDFNDTWPAPDMERLAAAAKEGRSLIDTGEDDGLPDVEQVVGMLDEGLNNLMSAIAEIRGIDERIKDIRDGKTKLKRNQTIDDAIKPLRADRTRYGREVVDTAASYEDVFGREAANAMIVEARKRLRGEETTSPGPRVRPTGSDKSTPTPEEFAANPSGVEYEPSMDDGPAEGSWADMAEIFDMAYAKTGKGGPTHELTAMPADQIFPPPAKITRAADVAKKAKEVLTPEQAAARIQSWKDHAERIGREEDHSNEVILSLFDRTGEWSKPYRDAGYRVVQFDIHNGDDLLAFMPMAEISAIEDAGLKVVGVLSATPCTSYAVSGARWWADQHDKANVEMVAKKYGGWAAEYFDTPLDYANTLVAATQAVIEFAKPTDFHVMENPVGRIQKMNDLPKPTLTFDPNFYGNPYTKKTLLWGKFNPDLPQANVEATEGSKIHKLRGDDPEQKLQRSETPEGFAYAFFMANNNSKLKFGEVSEEARKVAERDAPMWAEVLHALPKDEKDRPDTDAAFAVMKDRFGETTYNNLTPDQKRDLYDHFIINGPRNDAWARWQREKSGAPMGDNEYEALRFANEYDKAGRDAAADGIRSIIALGQDVSAKALEHYRTGLAEVEPQRVDKDGTPIEIGDRIWFTNAGGVPTEATIKSWNTSYPDKKPAANVETDPVGEGKKARSFHAVPKLSNLTKVNPADYLPGTEPIGDGELAQRRSDQPLKPGAVQEPADIGLFSDERDQGDMLNLPAVREQLFVDIGGRRLPLTSYEDASKAYRGALEKTGATMSGDTGPKAPQATIVNEKGEIVAHISQNGRVWQGKPEDQWQGQKYTPQPMLYDPQAAADGEVIPPVSPEIAEKVRNAKWVPAPTKTIEQGGIEPPDGYQLGQLQRLPKPVARLHGGEFSAVANRLSPWSVERGYGDTPEAAQRDALRRLGVEPIFSPSEASNGIPPSVSGRDAGPEPQDVPGLEEGRGAGAVRPVEGERSASDVRGADQDSTAGTERPADTAGSAGSGGPSEVDDVRVSGRSDDQLAGREEGALAGSADSGRAARNVKGENFHIEPGGLSESRSPKRKAEDNLRAIFIANLVIAEDRPATLAEQEYLSRYVGWGGIKGAFPDADGEYAVGYEKIGADLKEILTPEEYDTARRSIQYAHYTSEDIIGAMWKGAQQLGFEGGSVFEPGMGVGNFPGLMPTDLAARSTYQGVELDHVSARIAKLLYPQWGVRREDFTRMPLPDNAFDLAIGNPPFADISIQSDPKYKQGFLLHDYFFAKSLDAVRPGGLLMFVTSAGTMNKIDPKAREYLADRAEFVGAIRLPGNAFKKNAGTEVTTDIVILRKLMPGETADRAWTGTAEVSLPGPDGKPLKGQISAYFAEHPEMVLGKADFADKLYEGRYSVKAWDNFDLKDALAVALAKLPRNVMKAAETPIERAEADFDHTEKKQGSYYIDKAGTLRQMQNGAGNLVARRGKGVEGGKSAGEIERITGLVPIRDALRETYAADLSDDKEAGDRARAKLNKVYDAFVAKYGPINKAEILLRRPSVVQQETARAEAREEARYAGLPFNEGDFDANRMLSANRPMAEIARARKEAREKALAETGKFDEGSFDPEDMKDNIIDKRPNIEPFMDDQEAYRLRAIEHYDDTNGKAAKGLVFSQNVITRDRPPTIKSINDAALYVLNQKGRLDLDAIGAMVKKSKTEAIEALGDRIYRVPGTRDTWETKEAYLSGNVRKKLALAKKEAERDSTLRRNVEALEAAQPVPLAPAQIYAGLGMPWIPEKIVEQFAKEELGLSSFKAKYIKVLAQWTVSGDTDSVAAITTFGTSRRNATALISDALNHITPKIYDEVEDKRILNVAATQDAQDKLQTIKDRFKGWIFADDARADPLAAHYNENYNNLVVRQYDGSYLSTPGIATGWKWRPHQTRVIARIIQDGNTYMAHAVGAGKTSAMIGAGMEMRRLGLVKKPMYVVPNHMLAQFTKEFYEQYPTARIAVADDRNFHADRRKQFMANVALDDLDAIIITHTNFGMIPVSDEFSDEMIRVEMDKYRNALSEMPSGQDSRITRSRIEKQIERLEQRLSGKSTRRRDNVFTFDEMGADFVFVDEAQEFRKLDFTTQMSNLKGITPEGSGKAWDLYVKTKLLEKRNPGRNLVLASGTPVTNTMAELYTLSRYLQPGELAERDLSAFDAWAGAFGEEVSELEQDAAGGYKPVSRFAKFINVAELSSMVRQVMDVVTSRQLEQYVTRPKIKGGKRQMYLAEKSPDLAAYQDGLAARMVAIKNRGGKPQPGDDIMLTVIGDGRHAAIDMRLVGGESDPDYPSKLETLIDNVHQTIKDTARTKFYRPAEGGYDMSAPVDVGPATQMVFSNLGISAKRGLPVHDYIRAELVRRGVPRDKIALISEYKTHVAKQKLFNDMNSGKVLVMIGSVQKMGTGVNAQRRLIAIHNLDPLWYPSDDEQRNGRGLRQGNWNPELGINDYSTKGTYDSTMWGLMEKKARFIHGFFEGDPSMREMDDLGEASQYAQAKAMTTNDPRLMRLTELKQDLERAERRKSAFESERYAVKRRQAEARSNLDHYGVRAVQIRQDIRQRQDISGEKFKGTVAKTTFDKRVDFGEALLDQFNKVATPANVNRHIVIGEVSGFPITVHVRRTLTESKDAVGADILLKRSGEAYATVHGTSALGIARSIESTMAGFDSDLEHAEGKVALAEKFLSESAGKESARFQGDPELNALADQVRTLEAELSKKDDQPAPGAERPPPTEEALASVDPLTPAAAEKRVELERLLTAAVRKMAPTVNIKIHVERIPFEGAGGWGDIAAKYKGVAGLYRPAKHLIEISLDSDNPISAAFHEAYHAIEHLLQTARERELMVKETPRIRKLLKLGVRWTPQEIEGLAGSEVRAIGFELYRKQRLETGSDKQGLHVGVRRWYHRLADLTRQIRNGVNGLGFQTMEDIYEKAFDGGFADRQPALLGTPYPKEEDAQAAIEAANDEDAFDREHGATYEGALRAQQIERYVGEDTKRGDFAYWKAVAERENITLGYNSRPSANAAARKYSEGGKTTLLINYDGRRVVYRDGMKVVRERLRDDEALASVRNPFNGPLKDSVGEAIEEKLASTKERLIEGYQNLNRPVQNLEGIIEARLAGELPDSQAFYQKKRLFPGKVAAEASDFNKNRLDPLIDLLKRNGIDKDAAGDILYALHAPERNREMDKINMDSMFGAPDMVLGRGSGMSNDTAAQILARYNPALIEQIDQHAGAIRDYINNLMVQGGLENPATVKSWQATYDHYVPLSGWEDAPEEAPPGYSAKFTVRGPEVRSAFGRKSKADNPLANLIDQAYRTIERAKKNEYLQSLDNALHELEPDDLKNFVRFDKGLPKKEISKRTGLVRTVESSGYRGEAGAVPFKRGGNVQYMIFENPQLAEAIKRMHADGVGYVQKLIDFQNKLKATWTHYSPEFLLRHFLFRYPIEGTLNSFEQKEQGQHSVGRYIADSTPFLGSASKAIFATNKGVRSNDPHIAELQQYWDEMRKAGGAMMFRQMRDTNLVREHMEAKLNSLTNSTWSNAKAKWQASVEAMDTVTNALDNALRLAAYASARKQGKTPEQAAVIARDATVDFQQSGRWKNIMSLFAPFSSVAINTGARMTSAVARSRIMRMVFGSSILAGFLSGMFNYLIGGDDKDGLPFADKMAWWEKSLTFTLLNPFDRDAKDRPQPIHIPMPYNWAFPLMIGQAAAAMAFTKDPHGVKKALGAVFKSGLEALTPFGAEHNIVAQITPELTRPIVHAYTNESWNGIPVHADPAFQKGPRSESGRKTTGDGWKWMAHGLNSATGGDAKHSGVLDVYPEDLRDVLSYYSGTDTIQRFGRNVAGSIGHAAAGEPQEPSRIPFARVVRGTDYDAADKSRMFERRREEKQPWTR